MGLIALAVVLMTPDDDDQLVKGRRLTIQDFFSEQMKPRMLNGTWISGREEDNFFNFSEGQDTFI